MAQQSDVTASAISCISLDLEQALKREGRLKEKVQELTKKLEKLHEHEKNSEMRHQQSVSFVNELKKANRYKLCGVYMCHVIDSTPGLGVLLFFVVDSVCPDVCLSVTPLQIDSSPLLSHFLAVISPCGTLQNVLRFLI